MTIAHARRYLWTLRHLSPSMSDTEHLVTKREAAKLARAAEKASNSRVYGPDLPYDVKSDREYSIALRNWDRLLVHIYDESVRLREIAEGAAMKAAKKGKK